MLVNIEMPNDCWHSNIYEHDNIDAQLSWACKKFYKPKDWYHPACEILLQIASVSSEGSNEPAYQCSLPKVITALTHKVRI